MINGNIRVNRKGRKNVPFVGIFYDYYFAT